MRGYPLPPFILPKTMIITVLSIIVGVLLGFGVYYYLSEQKLLKKHKILSEEVSKLDEANNMLKEAFERTGQAAE
jgi:hypothetical protein